MSKIAKGNYYRHKTIEFLKEQGYEVEILEKHQRVMSKGQVLFIKRDIWGCDLIAKNDSEIIFIQCKTNRADISKGMKELNKTPWPSHVKRWVVLWTPREKEPEIIEAGGPDTSRDDIPELQVIENEMST